MTNSVVINAEQHGDSGWVPVSDYQHTTNFPFVAVSVDEVSNLLPSYTLAFITDEKTGATRLVALTGNKDGANLYVAPNGRWMASYIPRAIRLYPFQIQQKDSGENDFSLAFDMESDCFKESIEPDGSTLAFFAEDNKPSKALQAVLKGFEQEMRGKALTQKALHALLEHEVLRPWPKMQNLTVPGKVHGLQIISEKKLNEISPEALQELQKTGALALAYAQLYSMQRINFLQQLADMRQKHDESQTAPVIPDLPDELFGEGDDVLEFNF